MDKSAIKTYAVDARCKLIEAVKLKARQLYIFEDSSEYIKRKITQSDVPAILRSDGIFLSSEQLQARERLYNELLHEGSPYKPAIYNRVMENVACTWFNRLIALRVMEVNDWLPSNIRILSSREPGRIEPDAVREVERLDYVSQSKLAELRADTAINAAEKLYKHILTAQCNALSDILPGMFQKANDYTELLLPDALHAKGGVVNDLINGIDENSFKIRTPQDETAIINGTLKEEDAPAGQIEIIGWLYQFYISEKKDEVFAQKKNVSITKDTIPAITQLFTPKWIVRYMVENSLGRLWLEGHPNNDLLKKWKYFILDAEQTPEVEAETDKARRITRNLKPEEIKLIDPCMGSGHILVYAFDVLYQIYFSQGYSEREIPNLILRNNLYGLDIDDRAGQLAYFALMMKARSYNRRFFRQDHIPQPKVCAVPETKPHIFGFEKWLGASMAESDRKACFSDLKYLAELFSKGKEYGSLLKIDRDIDFDRLRKYVRDFKEGQLTTDDVDLLAQADSFDRLIDVAAVLSQRYDVVVTNPPYMTPAPSQADWIKKHYPDSKSDLCVVFIERNFELLKQNGYLSMITMHSWMFLSSYEKFRQKLIASRDIVNMAHLGARAFEEIGGEVVQTTAFTMRGSDVPGYLGTYARLVDYGSQQAKENAFLAGGNRHTAKKENFEKIPGWPVAYWVPHVIFNSFDVNKPLSELADFRHGMSTSDNEKYMRLWSEVSLENTNFNALSKEDTFKNIKWFPYLKGGTFRRWYGNQFFLVNWQNDGEDIKRVSNEKYPYLKGNLGFVLGGQMFFFKPGFTWSSLTTGKLGIRAFDNGFLFDAKGQCYFSYKEENGKKVMAFLNSCVFDIYGAILSPTLDYNSGVISKAPYINTNNPSVEELVTQNIAISRADWDNFETSWDFKRHPLITWHPFTSQQNREEVETGYHVTNTMQETFERWERVCTEQFTTLKSNEEELNRIFIDIYGLQDELTPEVEDKDVTVRKADLGRDIRSFISYAVGCMFGRYSLDEPGLAFAGGTFDITKYKTFLPEDDNIIPIGSADYFDDDIVVRFIEFVRAVYGDNTLGENLSFIADALYPNGSAGWSGAGTAQERIRRYFLNDFYKDHVKIYQKRPIYWLMDSGKKDGFKALFYLHRYDKYTVARARTDYLHPLQRKYDAEIKRLEMLSGSTDNIREKAAYRKEIDVLIGKIDECRIYDQVIAHIAHQHIELDLDDGVVVNYAKFQGVEVPKDNGKSDTMDLLTKI